MMHGLTGVIQFDNEGFRTNIMLDIMELSYIGLERVGTWSAKDGLNIIRAVLPTSPHHSENLQNRTFRVITALVSSLLLKLRCTKPRGTEKTVEIIIWLGLFKPGSYLP
jgi:hypothetical protein